MSLVQEGRYECGMCGGTFIKIRPEEDVAAEAAEDPFGFQTPPDGDPFGGEMATICNDCYLKMAYWVVSHGGIERAMACVRQDAACTHM